MASQVTLFDGEAGLPGGLEFVEPPDDQLPELGEPPEVGRIPPARVLTVGREYRQLA